MTVISAGIKGVDRATAFSDDELDVLKSDYGVECVAFYLGGPYYDIHGWQKADVERTRAKGFHVVPIYVGQNAIKGSPPPVLTSNQAIHDGTQAIDLLNEFGFSDPKDIAIALDVEESTYQYSPEDSAIYADEWCNTVHLHGAIPGAYGSLNFVDKMISTNRAPGWFWMARWEKKGFDNSLSLDDMPGLPNTTFTDHQRAWQYAGNVGLHGLNGNVDIDLFDITKTIAPETTTTDTQKETTVTSTESAPTASEVNDKVTAALSHLNAAINLLKEV